MDYFMMYHMLINDPDGQLSDTQKNYLLRMKEDYRILKASMVTSSDVVEGVEAHNEKLEEALENKRQESYRLERKIKSQNEEKGALDKQLQSLKKRKIKAELAIKEAEQLLLETQSAFKGKAISKGILQKKYDGAVEVLSEIYDYTCSNKCKTQKSVENNIRKQTLQVIAACGDCKRPELFCECEE